MKSLRENPWYVRVASLLAVVWAAWLLAFVVWAWSFGELRAGGNVAAGYTAVSVMALCVVAIGFVAAIWRRGWGAVGGGLLVTLVAAIGSGDAVDKLDRWGEVGVVDVADRTTPWVPLDSLGSVPYWVLLPAGVLLVVGGVVHVVRATRFSAPEEGWKEAMVKHLHAASWTVRAAVLLVGLWAVWLLAFVVWAWAVPELRSGDEALGYTATSAVIFLVIAVGLLAAIWRPGRGEIVGGLVVTTIAAAQGGSAVNMLTHWGETADGATWVRRETWVPLDSVSGVPYWVLLAAGVLLVLGGFAHALHPANAYVRVASMLVAVWAVWLLTFVMWVASTPELGTENNLGMDVLVWSAMGFVAVASGLGVAIAWPRWGAIGGGLLVIGVAKIGCQSSLDALQHWGEIQIGTSSGRSTSSPWVPLDSVWLIPYWVLLPAGVLLVVGGILQVAHPAHGSTPRAGAAT